MHRHTHQRGSVVLIRSRMLHVYVPTMPCMHGALSGQGYAWELRAEPRHRNRIWNAPLHPQASLYSPGRGGGRGGERRLGAGAPRLRVTPAASNRKTTRAPRVHLVCAMLTAAA